MGNFVSSISEDAKQFTELAGNEQGDTPATPYPNDNNAKIAKKLPLFDPRSPSQGVSRTPLEIEERNRRIAKTRITNQINKENNLLTPDVIDDPIKTPTGPPKDLLSAFDPRSPNSEINRTPITYDNNVPVPVGRKIFSGFDPQQQK